MAAAATYPARAEIRRSLDDQAELARLRSRFADAAEALARGEALARDGRLDAAAQAFHDGGMRSPDGYLLQRRECEALTALGKRDAAIQACGFALQSSQVAENVRAMVRAFVDGPRPPSTEDLARALLLTARERDRAAKGNAGPASALCDIAASLGDTMILQRCATELETVAPDDVEALRARTLLAKRTSWLRFWAGWLALGAVVAATGAHAMGRSRRGLRIAGAVAVLGALTWGGLSAASPQAWAGTGEIAPGVTPSGLHPAEQGFLSKWKVDDAEPDSNIPDDKARDADPLEFGYWIQDVGTKAEHASKQGDHLASAKFYGALVKAVPDRAVSYRKMCNELELAGDLDRARSVCAAALLADGLLVQDYTHYVRLVLAQPGPISDVQQKSLTAVLKHMKEDPAGRDTALDLECQAGARTSNVAELKECTDALVAKAPSDPQTVAYQWALAMQQGNITEAEKLVAHARELGLRADGLDSMERATVEGASRRHNRVLAAEFAGALLFLAIAVGAWGIITRRRPNATGVRPA